MHVCRHPAVSLHRDSACQENSPSLSSTSPGANVASIVRASGRSTTLANGRTSTGCPPGVTRVNRKPVPCLRATTQIRARAWVAWPRNSLMHSVRPARCERSPASQSPAVVIRISRCVPCWSIDPPVKASGPPAMSLASSWRMGPRADCDDGGARAASPATRISGKARFPPISQAPSPDASGVLLVGVDHRLPTTPTVTLASISVGIALRVSPAREPQDVVGAVSGRTRARAAAIVGKRESPSRRARDALDRKRGEVPDARVLGHRAGARSLGDRGRRCCGSAS